MINNLKISIVLTLLGLIIAGCGPKWQVTPLEQPPPLITADQGMVVAAHPLAAEAGVSVLRDGGNAIDAAIAVLFMLNVVEPHASGLGGGGFALVRTANGEAEVVCYRERAPRKIDPSVYTDPADSLHLRIKSGGTSVCVPGAAAGWAALYDRWHTLPLARLARDAIRAAAEGFPVDQTLAGQIANNYKKISANETMARTFLKELSTDSGSDSLLPAVRLPYEVGDTLRQPELAETFRKLVERGLGSFYRGQIAEEIVAAVLADGGLMDLDDLEFYGVEITEPIGGKYKGYEVLTIPPPSRGGVALIEALNLFEYSGATKYGKSDPRSIHLMSQCIQQAYADARFLVADQKFTQTGWRRMLEKNHTIQASVGISPEAEPGPRSPVSGPDLSDAGNTTHLVVVDQWGNVVSLTQSINYFFGSGIMAGRTGLLLNNQMSDFNVPTDPPDPRQDTLNYIEGKKRPRSNMTPVIMLKDDDPVLIIGTPGGSRIIAAVAQIIVNVLDFNMDLAAAIDYPRYFPVREHLVLENRIDLDLLKSLKKTGYVIHLAGPYSTYFGGAHGITLPPLSEKIAGAADKRRGGQVRGY